MPGNKKNLVPLSCIPKVIFIIVDCPSAFGLWQVANEILEFCRRGGLQTEGNQPRILVRATSRGSSAGFPAIASDAHLLNDDLSVRFVELVDDIFGSFATRSLPQFELLESLNACLVDANTGGLRVGRNGQSCRRGRDCVDIGRSALARAIQGDPQTMVTADTGTWRKTRCIEPGASFYRFDWPVQKRVR